MRDFLFAEFAEGKPVEVLRVGEFIDRHGRRVTISENDLDSFVAMFEAGEAGQEVPVDVNHERSAAAGWVRRLWREGSKLLAEIDWNDLGRKLIGERIYRYLSASIDLQRKVLRSVSLVNFPAVKGLRPVELSEGVYAAAVVEAFTGADEEELPESEEMEEAEFIIRKEGNEIILYSSDGSKVLGRFPFGVDQKYATEEEARAAALKRERQIQWFKHREGGAMELDWAELQGNIKHIIAAWPKWAGSFTKCVQILRGKPGIYDPEPLCAWLHKQAEGKWPAEGSEYSPTLAELEAMVDALMSTITLDQQEVEQMDEKQLAELREQIRQELLAEMEQQEQTLAELREQVRAEVEAELQERMVRRQELIEFAEEICGGEAGLSAKPDDVVAFLESLLEGDQLDQAKALLKAKVVDFSERGSAGQGQDNKKKLPEAARKDVMSGELTVADLFAIGALPGTPEEYDLSEFTAEQKGL